MPSDRHVLLASAIVVATGSLWGFYWVPVRRLAELAVPGAWGTLAIVTAAALLLAPLAVAGRRRLCRTSPLALASIALGGVAFVFYSVGFVYGRVAVVILLFFLTPVWSTLIGHYVMGWPTSRLRLLAIGAGIAGLGLMLGGDGGLPLPRGIGDWLGLAAGLLWSLATTLMRVRVDTRPGETAFVFALGGVVGAAALAPWLAPWPGLPAADLWPTMALSALAGGGIWWGLSIVGLMWATARLEPARVGILLMSEVLVGTASAALLAGEHLRPIEILGGALVLTAGLVELWPSRRGRRP